MSEHEDLVPIKTEAVAPSLSFLEVNKDFTLDDSVKREYLRTPTGVLSQIDILLITGQTNNIHTIREYIKNTTNEEIKEEIIKFHIGQNFDFIATSRAEFLERQRDATKENLMRIAESPEDAQFHRMTNKLSAELSRLLTEENDISLDVIGEFAKVVEMLQKIDPVYRTKTRRREASDRIKESKKKAADKAQVILEKIKEYQAGKSEGLDGEMDTYERMTERIINGEEV